MTTKHATNTAMLLTLDEARNRVVCWIEYNRGGNLDIGYVIAEKPLGCDKFTEAVIEMPGQQPVEWLCQNYNRTWRCWAQEPTYGLRDNTMWSQEVPVLE